MTVKDKRKLSECTGLFSDIYSVLISACKKSIGIVMGDSNIELYGVEDSCFPERGGFSEEAKKEFKKPDLHG